MPEELASPVSPQPVRARTASGPAPAGTGPAGPTSGARQARARRRVPRVEREAMMLDAAETLFGERGYQAVSMDEIATRVGVSKPMLYHYFGSKERLFLACLRRARAQMRQAILAGTAEPREPGQALYASLVAWFRFIDERPQTWTMMVDEGLLEFGAAADEIEDIRAEHTELIAELIMAQAPPGHAENAEEMQVVAAAISGVGERITRWRTRHPGLSPETTARHLMQLLWLGLGRMADGDVWHP